LDLVAKEDTRVEFLRSVEGLGVYRITSAHSPRNDN
jgi:hypothetical protein